MKNEVVIERPVYTQRLKAECLKLRDELASLHYHRERDPLHVKGSDRIGEILSDKITFEFDLRILGEDI